MKYILLLILFHIANNSCGGLSYIEYQGNCYSTCNSFNMLYHRGIKTCVKNCKSSDYYRYENECAPSCSLVLKNPSDLDDFCVNDCFIFLKGRYDGACVESCKANNLINYVDHICSTTCNYYIFEDQKEKYCVPNCLVYGKYKNSICADNCKAIGKFNYKEACETTCPFANPAFLLTEEENYCVNNCYRYDLVKSKETSVCEPSCKSVGEILFERGKCDKKCATSGYSIYKYKDEDYCVNCLTYELVKDSNTGYCYKTCRELNKINDENSCKNSCGLYIYKGIKDDYCIYKSTCTSFGKYISSGYCQDECPNNNCNEECGENQYYSIPNKLCVNNCKEKNLFLYEDKFCVSSCGLDYPYIYQSETENICVNICPENAKYLIYETSYCSDNCNNLYLFNNICYNSCPLVAEYVNEEDGNKNCVENCHDLNLYNRLEKKMCADNCKKYSEYFYANNCFSSCPEEAPYYMEGELENTCHKNCEEVGLLNNIYDKLCVSNCKNINQRRFENRCVKTCPRNAFYVYETDEETYCVEDCSEYNQRAIFISYKNDEFYCTGLSCKEQDKTLYNNFCINCPKYIMFKVVGANEDFCTKRCGEYGLKENFNSISCINDDSLECDGNYKDLLNNQCVEKCPDEVPYVFGNKCVKSCEKFFMEDSKGNKICTENCDDKFILINSKKCVSSCDSVNLYKLNGYNICYSNCNANALIPRYNTLIKDIFSLCVENCLTNDNTKKEDECKDICRQPFKFRIKDNESNKVCYQSCKEINMYEYINEDGNYFCVDNCKNLNRILYKNKCIEKCPTERKIKTEKNGEFICENNCEDNQYIKIDDITKEYSCVNNCKDINLIFDDNKCINECPKERPFIILDGEEKKCSENCESGKYINIENDKKKCVSSCKDINKYINGNTCVNECPSIKSFKIMKNNEIYCSESCDNEYKYLNEINKVKYCVKSCLSNFKMLYNNKCVEECPESNPLEIDLDNEKECSSQCKNNNYLLEQDKKLICVDDCTKYNKFSFEGKCISECPKGKKLFESEGTKQCVDNCRQYNLFEYENICTNNCKLYNKIGYNNSCIDSCPDSHPFSVNNICRESLCEETQFYDNLNKKCLSKCDSLNNYHLSVENSCINSCKNIESNKIYSILGNECVDNCNEQRKYLFNYKNEYYCIDKCEDQNLVISGDGKFCVEKCDKDYPYIENGKCIKNCPNYFYENNGIKTCVNRCPEKLPFIYNSECVNSCYDNFLYILYNTNICISKCSNDLILNSNTKPEYYLDNYNNCLDSNDEEICNKPFYFIDKENRICYQNCSQSNDLKYVINSQECVGLCPYGIKENNICNNEDINQSSKCDNNYNKELENSHVSIKKLIWLILALVIL